MSTQVAVVMSTYNGERYLSEQVESILGQEGVDVRLIVRDDGSSDGTVGLLESYERQGRLELVRGENLGVTRSFLELVRIAAERGYAYVALSDQDDVWHADKLSRAVGLLSSRSQSEPLLYCSEYTYCDESLHETARSRLCRIGFRLETMLYENMTSGNTIVINHELARRVSEAGPDGVYTHDWWLSLVASAIGELVYDDFSSLEYRRLEDNASPSGRGWVAIASNRIRRFVRGGDLKKVTAQIAKLQQAFGMELAPEREAVVRRFLGGNRLGKVFAPMRLRQKPLDEVLLRLLFLVGAL